MQNERIVFYRLGHDSGGYFVGDLSSQQWTGMRYSLVLIFDDTGVLKEHSMVKVR